MGDVVPFPPWARAYSSHSLNKDGVILKSTTPKSVTGIPLPGISIEHIFPPGDATVFRHILSKAAAGHKTQWWKYAITNQAFLARIDYLSEEDGFIMHEAKIETKDTKRFMNLLSVVSAEGCQK